MVRPAALFENNLDCFMISLSILVVGNLLCFYVMVPAHAKWDLSQDKSHFGYFSWLWALIVLVFLRMVVSSLFIYIEMERRKYE